MTKPYIVMSDSSPVEGTLVTMRCGLENGTGPINYVWEQESRESQLTTVAEIYDDNRLNVTDVNRNHTGWYRCIASNQVNQQRSDRVWLDTICKRLLNSLWNKQLNLMHFIVLVCNFKRIT